MKQDAPKEVKLEIATDAQLVSLDAHSSLEIVEIKQGSKEMVKQFVVRRVVNDSDIEKPAVFAIVKRGELEERIPLRILIAK